MSTKKKVNVGLIGAGRIGLIHGGNVAKDSRSNLLMVSDVYFPAAERIAAALNIPHAVKDYRDILRNPDIDAVLICSSTDTHAQILGEAAQAGKHVFCEKPIDYDLQKIDHALELVRKSGIKLMIGFNRRFDPNYKRLQRAVESGEIGVINSVRIVSRDPAPPPAGYVSPGLFLDCSIHDFDMARWLMGSEVVEVFATGLVTEPQINENPDTAHTVLKFANGRFATIDNSRRSVWGYDQRAEVFGNAGAAESANVYPHTCSISTAKQVHNDLPLNFFLERYAASFAEEINAFITCLVENTPFPNGPLDGRIPVVIALAAMKSYAENRAVKLSEVDSAAKL
mmetsp:Transcript_54937/g.91306  ORF Transcript_54937/g.91306 Transcript_54937/m.91306 type:complete len:340 (+) Transcript_54937:33-1052(+)